MFTRRDLEVCPYSPIRPLTIAHTTQTGEILLDIPSSALLNPLTIKSSPCNTIPSHVFPLTEADLSAQGAIKGKSNGVVKRKRLSAAPRLNATQIMCLHLLLTRDTKARHVSDWAAYIATLPDFEGWHPLTWLYAEGAGVDEGEDEGAGAVDGQGDDPDAEHVGEEDRQLENRRGVRDLVECLTPRARAKLQDVQERYEVDKAAMRHVLVS